MGEETNLPPEQRVWQIRGKENLDPTEVRIYLGLKTLLVKEGISGLMALSSVMKLINEGTQVPQGIPFIKLREVNLINEDGSIDPQVETFVRKAVTGEFPNYQVTWLSKK